MARPPELLKSIAITREKGKAMTRDEFNEAIILDTLRRFMLNSDLSDRRISRLMGVEIETLRTWIAGTANPRKQSLNKIRSFLKWHGRKDKDWLSDYCRGFLPDLCD